VHTRFAITILDFLYLQLAYVNEFNARMLIPNKKQCNFKAMQINSKTMHPLNCGIAKFDHCVETIPIGRYHTKNIPPSMGNVYKFDQYNPGNCTIVLALLFQRTSRRLLLPSTSDYHCAGN
jgi:hypothetical protein